jgi:hypothetical protein
MHYALKPGGPGHVIQQLLAADAQIRESVSYTTAKEDDMSATGIDEQANWMTFE